MSDEKTSPPQLFTMSLDGAKQIFAWMQEKPYKEVFMLIKHFEQGKLAYETDLEKKEEFKIENLK